MPQASPDIIHPLAPLSALEISHAVQIVRSQWPASIEIHFKEITLQEPPKAEIRGYKHSAHTQACIQVERRALLNYYVHGTVRLHEAVVNLSRNCLVSSVRLAHGVHGPCDAEEIELLEERAVNHPLVRAELVKLGLPKETKLVADQWVYGSDGAGEQRILSQMLMYMRDPGNPTEEDSCHYAFPLPFSPVICNKTLELVRIDRIATGGTEQAMDTVFQQESAPSEYLPEYQRARAGLKPLDVVQPEGPSFSLMTSGGLHEIQWQNWKASIGFNRREGMILYDIRYDERSLFDRVSLSEMVVPYADPRDPMQRKSAFDLGDAGAGASANSLRYGCDCIGRVQYLSATLHNRKGEPMEMPDIICVHEQDQGIGWKHTNYRTGRSVVVRNRELVIQMMMTIANYDYILAYIFNQAGELTFEIRATGILSTQPVDKDVDEVPFGTIVHPGVLAAHHQHIFSLRIEPAIDGPQNRVVYEECIPLPRSDTNLHGTGYISKETTITQSGGYDLDSRKGRVFKILNSQFRNPVNNKPVGYKIKMAPFQTLLADANSLHYLRAEFADKHLYIVRHRDGDLYPAGRYTNQSRGGQGVRSWAARDENLVDEDIVLYLQMGLSHVPRTEDFPVMPCETLRLTLQPVNFFTKNPALDVPEGRSTDPKGS